MSPTKLLIGQIFIVFAIMVSGVWAATQWCAAMLGYQPQLGQAWLEMLGFPIYRPWAIFAWWYHYDAYAPEVFDKAGTLAGASGFLGCAAAIAGSLWRARQASHVTTYGSARWAGLREIRKAGLLRPVGVFLGTYAGRYLRHDGERQRLEADRKAARESGVMMQIAGASGARQGASTAGSGAAVSDAGTAAEDRSQDLDRIADPNGQRRKVSFLRQGVAASDVNSGRLVEAPSPYTLSAGSIITASLITGLNSDLPGLVTAQISENAYDSATGQILLLPQGSRLIGRYDSVLAFGQSRALVTWNRMVLPDGSSIRIDNMPATDTSGYAGLSDSIDRHTWQLLKGVALSTLLGVGNEISFGDERSDLIRALRQSAQQNGARAGYQIVGRSLEIQPTLKVRPGWPLRVLVHRDIVLRPWRQGGA